MTNRLLTEYVGLVGIVAPSSQAAGAVTTGPYTLTDFRKLLFTVLAGAVGGAGTVNFKLQASPDGTTGFVDVPGAAIVPIATSNKAARIEVRADRLKALNLGSFVQGVLTVAGNAVPTAVFVEGGDARYLPASDYNAAAFVTPDVVL